MNPQKSTNSVPNSTVAHAEQGRVLDGNVLVTAPIALRLLLEADDNGIAPLVVRDSAGQVVFDGDVTILEARGTGAGLRGSQ